MKDYKQENTIVGHNEISEQFQDSFTLLCLEGVANFQLIDGAVTLGQNSIKNNAAIFIGESFSQLIPPKGVLSGKQAK